MPVTQIDGRKIGKGTPGEITGQVADAYWQMHKEAGNQLIVKYPETE